MWLIEAAVYLIIAGACAGLGQFVTGYSRGGCPVSFVAALIGALIGPLVARRFEQPVIYELPVPNADIPVVWAAVGAFSLVLIINLLTHKRKF